MTELDNRYYAGIGSRKTPAHIIGLMRLLAAKLADDGWILRTGHAAGADQAFEQGARDRAEVYLPWGDYEAHGRLYGAAKAEPSIEAYDIAEAHHPAWDACSPGAKRLHARNSHIILGPQLNNPVTFVVWWAKPHEAEVKRLQGGTGQAVALAQSWEIPIRNLYYAKTIVEVCGYLNLDAHTYAV